MEKVRQLFFPSILIIYLAGVTPDMTCIGLGGDQFRWVHCAENFEAGNLLGYPTYITASWVLCHLPGNSFWTLGLFSALSTFFAGILIYLTIKHLVPQEPWAPYGAAAVFYGSFIVWTQSVIPEVYTPTILVATLATYLIVTKHHYWGAAAMALGLGLHLPTFLCAAVPLYLYAKRDGASITKMIGITSLGLLAYIQTFLCPNDTGSAGDPLNAALEASSSFGSLALTRTFARAQDAVPVILASGGLAFALLAFAKNTREARYFAVITVLSASVYLWSNEPSWVTYLAFSSAFFALFIGLAAAQAPKGPQLLILGGAISLLVINFGFYNIGDTVDVTPTQSRKIYTLIESITDYSDILVVSAGPEAEVVATYWEWEHPDNPLQIIKEHPIFLTPDANTPNINLPPLKDHSTYDNGLYVNWDSNTFATSVATLNPTLDVYQLYTKTGDNYADKDFALRYTPGNFDTP